MTTSAPTSASAKPRPSELAARLARLVIAFILVAIVAPLQAQDIDLQRAAQVKAALLAKFLLYTEWPPDSFADNDSPYRVGILGNDDIAGILQTLADSGQKIGTRGLQLQRLELPANGLEGLGAENRTRFVGGLKNLNLLYIGEGARSYAPQLLRAIDGAGVLSVGDGERFAASGGMIGFAVSGPHIVFDANLATMRRTPLMVDAKVLKLARNIETGALK